MTMTEHVVRWAGFTWSDRPPWRVISCNACGKFHYLMHASPESTEALVRAHRCGPIGTPWSVPQSSTAVPHAFLLTSMAQEVHRQPYGSYELANVQDAALELVAAITSQLPPGLVRIEWPDELVDTGVAIDAAGEPYDVDTGEPVELTAVELPTCGGCGATPVRPDDSYHLPDAGGSYPCCVGAPDELLFEVAATGHVSVAQLLDLEGLLGELIEAVAATGHRLVGIAWPAWDQCLDHVAADIGSGRLAAIHDPATLGRLIYEVEEPPACSGCALPTTGQTPAVP